MTKTDTKPLINSNIDFRENTRELVLSKLMDAIDYLHHKSLRGQIHRPENERVRTGYFKALVQACSVYNQISQGMELDELKRDMEALKREIKEDKK